MRQVTALAGHYAELFTLPKIFGDIQIYVISSNTLL